MLSQSPEEVESKVFGSRTSWQGRVIHYVGDSMIVILMANYLGSYLFTQLQIFSSLFYIFVAFIYYFLMESLLQRTLFKYLTRSIAVTGAGTKPRLLTIALRSLIRFVPLEQISFLFEQQNEVWWHDVWTKTYVVKVEKFEAALQSSKGSSN